LFLATEDLTPLTQTATHSQWLSRQNQNRTISLRVAYPVSHPDPVPNFIVTVAAQPTTTTAPGLAGANCTKILQV
jgi:hypothetical protein